MPLLKELTLAKPRPSRAKSKVPAVEVSTSEISNLKSQISDHNSVTITITIPIAEPTGYVASETMRGMSHVDTRMTSPEQLEGLRRAHMGLMTSHAQFANGRHVDSIAEVVRWLFEQIGIQAAKSAI